MTAHNDGAPHNDVFAAAHGVFAGPNRGYAEEMVLRSLLGEPVPDSWSGLVDDMLVDVLRSRGADYAYSRTDSGVTPSDIRACALVAAFEDHGFLAADVDPLASPTIPAALTLDAHGLAPDDVLRIDLDGRACDQSVTAAVLLEELRRRWCGSVTVESQHLEPGPRALVRGAFLEFVNHQVTPAELGAALSMLSSAEALESVLGRRFLGVKRFGLEGSETVLLVIDALLGALRDQGATGVELAMAHRGRFNVLVNIAGFPTEALFRAFEDRPDVEPSGAGDVKVHLGHDGRWTGDREFPVRVAYNPSHLETVFPVVLGMARRSGRVPVIVHGDAAFAGQGVVAEGLQMHRLDAYETGGAVHVVLDNRLGFTTDPRNGRSSRYASAPARAADIPIVRVNGASPEDCIRAGLLAARIRELTGGDVCVHFLGWRSNGHNEGDDPSFTQPVLYQEIGARPSPRAAFVEQLVSRGALAASDGARFFEVATSQFLEVADRVRASLPAPLDTLPAPATPATPPSPVTGLNASEITDLLRRLAEGPAAAGFVPQDKVARVLAAQFTDAGNGSFSWALGEALGYASVLESGLDVRLVGEDSRRGTFAHRHAVLVADDGREFERFGVFGPGRFSVHDSLLSEYAALAFEYGFDINAPGLTLWEAQFGDFVNGAQIVLDTCLANGESKWGYRSGLVLLLPHGAEGQGPEHSSARPERFLQLGAHGSLRMAAPSTAAQVFHLLRRQALDPVRLPLVVLTPKSHLRTEFSRSTIEEFAGSFQTLTVHRSGSAPLRRVVLALGKIASDLLRVLPDDVALCRIEELLPLPVDRILETLADLSADRVEVVLLQEEMGNCGIAPFLLPALHERGLVVRLVAPAPLPSNSPGSAAWAAAINADLLQRAVS